MASSNTQDINDQNSVQVQNSDVAVALRAALPLQIRWTSVKPLIEIALDLLQTAGVSNFYLLTFGCAVIILVVRSLLLGLIAWLDILLGVLCLIVVVRVAFQAEGGWQRGSLVVGAERSSETKRLEDAVSDISRDWMHSISGAFPVDSDVETSQAEEEAEPWDEVKSADG